MGWLESRELCYRALCRLRLVEERRPFRAAAAAAVVQWIHRTRAIGSEFRSAPLVLVREARRGEGPMVDGAGEVRQCLSALRDIQRNLSQVDRARPLARRAGEKCLVLDVPGVVVIAQRNR